MSAGLSRAQQGSAQQKTSARLFRATPAFLRCMRCSDTQSTASTEDAEGHVPLCSCAGRGLADRTQRARNAQKAEGSPEAIGRSPRARPLRHPYMPTPFSSSAVHPFPCLQLAACLPAPNACTQPHSSTDRLHPCPPYVPSMHTRSRADRLSAGMRRIAS